MLKRYRVKNFDFLLILAVMILTIIGILSIGSAQESVQLKQFYGAIIGFIVMILLSFIDYSFILRFYWFLYCVNIILLIAVQLDFIGKSVSGAQRWVEIGTFRFQPSETAKILLILFFAQFIMKYNDKLNSLRVIGLLLIFLLAPLALVYRQPDLSTSIIIAIIFCSILYIAGLSYKIIISFFVVLIPTITIFMIIVLQEGQTLIDGYQRLRIMGWLYPEDYFDISYQQTNSIIAIGSGQLLGKGLNNNSIASVVNGNFISQPQTDFIFSVVGEELGFIGCIVVILLIMFIVFRCIITARKAKDMAGTLIATGIATLFGFQSLINIGVATFLLPNTGIPLPFVSYGVTSLVCSFMGIGLVLNIGLQKVKKYQI